MFYINQAEVYVLGQPGGILYVSGQAGGAWCFGQPGSG